MIPLSQFDLWAVTRKKEQGRSPTQSVQTGNFKNRRTGSRHPTIPWPTLRPNWRNVGKNPEKDGLKGIRYFQNNQKKWNERTEADPGILGRTIQGNQISIFPYPQISKIFSWFIGNRIEKSMLPELRFSSPPKSILVIRSRRISHSWQSR